MYKFIFKATAIINVLIVAWFFLIHNAQAFDLQGHRGARGLMPENTLPGFTHALSLGVTTLELDVGVSRDNIVVISHNPRLDKAITRNIAGKWLMEEGVVIHATDYQNLKQYDVGRINPDSRYASRFPHQTAIDGTIIPTLNQVFDLAKHKGNSNIRFNIETKLHPNKPDLTLAPSKFVNVLLKVIRHHGMSARVTVQSFDWRTLQIMQKRAPEIQTSYLSVSQSWLDTLHRGKAGASPWMAGFDIDKFQHSVPRAVKAAGGHIWSPYHKEVTQKDIAIAHQLGLKVKVWTVNDPHRMEELIALGVDGIITDYPDRLRTVLHKLGMELPKVMRAQ